MTWPASAGSPMGAIAGAKRAIAAAASWWSASGTSAAPRSIAPLSRNWLTASRTSVSSSLANLNSLLALEKAPFLEIHPLDAAARGIGHGDRVIVENRRGSCTLAAAVTDGVRPGVVVSPKGHWPRHGDGRNINWTTSDALGDMAGQSTFHCNRVWVRPANDHAPASGQQPGTRDQRA